MADGNKTRRSRPRTIMSIGTLLVVLAVYALSQWNPDLLGTAWQTVSDDTAATATATPRPKRTPTRTPKAATATARARRTATAQAALAPTATPKPTRTPQKTAAPATATARARRTATAQAALAPTATPKPRATRTPNPVMAQAQTGSPTAAAPTATPRPTPTANAPPTRASSLPTVRLRDLPQEARDTVALIDQGGPFPFRQDGAVFQNRERILPRKAEGYYHEYTVITPDADDRGARRIVTGDGGEMYYTDDHYDSFREIIR